MRRRSLRSLGVDAFAAAAVIGVVASGCGTAVTVEDAASATTATTVAEVTTTAPPTTVPPTNTTPTTLPPTTTTPPPAVFDFATAADIDGWSVVNDTVMGGVSTGQLAWNDGALVFTGDLSLDNNGGFASVRSPRLDPDTAAAWKASAGLGVGLRGDGRVWTVEVRTDIDDGGWISPVTTTAGEITEVELPWTSFDAVTRFLDPREPAVPLDPTRIVSVAFYLVDGIEAPFRLELRSVS